MATPPSIPLADDGGGGSSSCEEFVVIESTEQQSRGVGGKLRFHKTFGCKRTGL